MSAAAFSRPSRRRVLLSLGGLVLALGVVSLPFGDWDHEFADVWHLVGNEAIWWAYIAAVLLYVTKIERRSLGSIGFHKLGIRNALIGVAAGILITALLGALYYVVLPALHLNDAIASTPNARALAATPFWWRLISTVRAAVSEEVLFRGYAIERIQELTGSRTIAVIASCAIFTLDHVSSWGWTHEAIVAFGGLSFALLYVWRRNLWTSIIAHFIVDGISVLA